MYRRIACWVALLVSGLFLGQASAQALRGQVLMPDGSNPTRRLRLILDDDEGMRMHEILYTDSNGRFTFITVPEGRYRITIDSDGPEFATTVKRIRINVNRYIIISLLPSKEEPLPPGDAAVVSVPAKAQKAYRKAAKNLEKRQNEKAEEQLKQALELHPRYFEAHNDLGMLYLQTGRLQEAEAHLRRAIQANSEDFRPRYNLGVTLVKQQRFDEAAGWLREVLNREPMLADAHFYLGVAAYGIERLDEAEEHLQRAYELEPEKEIEALMFLGNVYYLKNDLDKAIAKFQEYLEALPSASNAEEVRRVIERLEKERKS